MTPVAGTIVLLLAMIGLQSLWLLLIVLSRATLRLDKVRRLGAFTLVAGLVVLTPGLLVPQAKVCLFAQQAAGLFTGPAGAASLVGLTAIGAGYYARLQRTWPFDEEGNENAASVLADQGLASFFAQYGDLPWLGMQHPPLIPIIGGFLLRILGKHRLVLRLISVFFLVGSLAITYQVGALLYGPQTGLLGMVLLLSFPLCWRLGSAAMLDSPAMFWFGLAVLAALNIPSATSSIGLAGGVGLVVGLGLLTRYTLIVVYPVLLAFVFLRLISWQAFGVVVLVSGLLFALWLIYAARLGVLGRQFDRLVIYSGQKPGESAPQSRGRGLLFRLGLTRGWRMRIRLESLVSRLPSAIGPYNLAILALGLRQLLYTPLPGDLVISLWFGVPAVLFLVLLPDHRYFMLTFPALALVMARGLSMSPPCGLFPTLLALLLCLGNLYLFVDWKRETHLFSTRGV
jgi:4-amino-4-deoxy-L-arabinose transferase-like glycosyltransferase